MVLRETENCGVGGLGGGIGGKICSSDRRKFGGGWAEGRG